MATEKTTVVITGSNQGIGFATAEILARSTSPTYHVLICSRDHAKGEAAAAKLAGLPGTVEALDLDITDASSIAAASDHISKTLPKLDVVINNAGIEIDWKYQSGELSLAEVLRQTLDTNVIGTAAVTEALLPTLRKSADPRLIFVTSELGSIGMVANKSSPEPGGAFAGYRISKAATNMLMMTYTARLSGEKPVKTWTLCPGHRATNLNAYQATLPVEGAGQFIVDVLQGRRDGDAGKFVHEGGLYSW